MPKACEPIPRSAVNEKVVPLPEFALDFHFPAHQFHQPNADGQTEAGSSILASRRGIRLLEGLKNRLQLICRQSDSGVLHCKAKLDLLFFLTYQFDTKNDLAALGELDGVAQQVQQNLSNPMHIADQPFGNPRIDVEGQLQSFVVGSHCQGAECFADSFAQFKVRGIEFQFLRLDFGKVEDVVDQRQQRISRRFDGR